MTNDIIPNGSEVFIFKYLDIRYLHESEKDYIKGVIKNSKMMYYPGMHGSFDGKCIYYTVIGEDNKEYSGIYGFSTLDYYFLTKEDYIKRLEQYISKNNNKIEFLKNENSTYSQIINYLKSEKSNTTNKHKVLVKKQK